MVIMIKCTIIKIYKRYHSLEIHSMCFNNEPKEEANIYNISECPEFNKHKVKFYLYQAQSDFTFTPYTLQEIKSCLLPICCG